MDIPWRAALLVVAAAFLVFLIAKLLPGGPARAAASPGLSAARTRARAATTPRDRALALCDAAEAALAQPFGSTRAAAYFLRAMRADPSFAGSVERATAALARRRARLLEKLLWRRLAATPWDAEHHPVVRALVTSLAAVSKGSRAHAAQAEVLERVLAGESLRIDQTK
jgi:hypothetical protein